MRPTPDVETPEDFHKYYRNQYLTVNYKDIKGAPLLVGGMDGSSVFGTVVINKEGAVENYILGWNSFLQSAQFGIPTLGMRNVGETVLYLYRHPERQWSRGYRPQGTVAYCPNEWELLRNNVPTPNAAHRKTVWQVFNPDYYRVGRAVELLLDGSRIGCALDARYALVTLRRCPFPVLVHRRSFVGYWDNRMVLHKLFAELSPQIEQRFSVPVEIEKEVA